MTVPNEYVEAAKDFLHELADRAGMDVNADTYMALQSMLEAGWRVLPHNHPVTAGGLTVPEMLFKALSSDGTEGVIAELEPDGVLYSVAYLRGLMEKGWIFIPPSTS